MKEWTVVTTDFQTIGMGQRGKHWESEEGMNLLMSVLVKPMHIEIQDQFVLSAAISVSIVECLAELNIAAEVKWPNDILVNSRKICGILIQNQWSNARCESSIVGVGLNVNQVGFSEYSWPATSIALELGEAVSIAAVRDSILNSFRENLLHTERYKQEIIDRYNNQLYRLNSIVQFSHNEKIIEGKVLKVKSDGAINLEVNNQIKTYVNGEVRLT
ncbi:MAG: biotin--[acetyl-CoA-carboxylase] ligase [Salibacteraceae bacterium]